MGCIFGFIAGPKYSHEVSVLTVFAGSGASYAVNPEKYPTTKGFFEKLPEHVTSDRLFRLVVEFANTHGSPAGLDIEQLLWHLDELWAALAPFAADRHIATWFAAANRLQQVLGRNVDTTGTFQLLNDVARESTRLKASINRLVYDHYGSAPASADLERTWIPLFRHVVAHSIRVEVFTTNYDVVIEEAARQARFSLATGRTSETMPRLNDSGWRADVLPDAAGPSLLTKLHGSVDWVRGSTGDIFTGSPNFVGDHERHVILYPGFKGRPDRAPFDAFHAWFGKVLRVTDQALFVGFAFRDGYINDIIRDSLPATAKIAVIDPAEEIDRTGLGSRAVRHIREGFGESAVSDALVALALA